MKSKGNCRLYHTPVRIFATVAGIGPELAERIHEHLAIESLTELEAAAYSGRLATVPALGRSGCAA